MNNLRIFINIKAYHVNIITDSNNINNVFAANGFYICLMIASSWTYQYAIWLKFFYEITAMMPGER